MRVTSICLLGMMALGVSGCREETNPRVVTRLNTDATLTGELPANPLQGRVMTSWTNKQEGTMSTMFGNDAAVGYARGHADGRYPAGAVLSVVTWGQQEDPRWFGGKIPERPRMVEFLTANAEGGFDYARYEGTPLKKVDRRSLDELDFVAKRVEYLQGVRAAVMP